MANEQATKTVQAEEADFLTALEAHMRADGSFSDAQITNILHACSGWVFSVGIKPVVVERVKVVDLNEVPWLLEDDEKLYCEACGLQIPDGRDGISVEAPGIPSGEIIVCNGCAQRLRAEAGKEAR